MYESAPLQAIGYRGAILGGSALLHSLRPDAAIPPQADPVRAFRPREETVPPVERILAPSDAGKARSTLVAMEGLRPGVATGVEQDPEARGRRRKLRLVPRSAWADRLPDLGRFVDLSV